VGIEIEEQSFTRLTGKGQWKVKKLRCSTERKQQANRMEGRRFIAPVI
jgi:hypothetical protein